MKLFGLEFSEGRVYTVVDNVASYATKEERAYGVTKAPQEGIKEKRSVPFHKVGSAKTPQGNPIGVFFTGFSTQCPSYVEGYTQKDKSDIVNFVQKFIVSPYETQMGVEGILASNNHSFWKGYSYDLFVGRTFNMDIIEDRLAMWFACLHGKVVTPLSEGSEIVAEAPYKLEDYQANKDAESDFLIEKDEARRYIDSLLSDNPDYLVSILRYKGVVSPNVTVDSKFLKLTAIRIFDGKLPELPVEKMLETVKEAQTTDGKSLITWYSEVQNLISHNKIVLNDSKYMYKNTVLGSSIKEVARKIADESSNLDKKIKASLLEELDSIAVYN